MIPVFFFHSELRGRKYLILLSPRGKTTSVSKTTLSTQSLHHHKGHVCKCISLYIQQEPLIL